MSLLQGAKSAVAHGAAPEAAGAAGRCASGILHLVILKAALRKTENHMLSSGLFRVFTPRILPSVPNSEGNEKGERLFLSFLL